MTPVEASAGPRFNAMKHGRRAEHILLPGENLEEFNEVLQELYETYRPRTRREIRCVEAVADYEWCIERNGRMRQFYHGKVLALQSGDPAAQPHCDHDPHRWHHSAQDCTREERRLKKLRQETLEELEILKQLRRQNLINDAMEAVAAREARPIFPKATLRSQPAGRADADPSLEACASAMPGSQDAPAAVPACAQETGPDQGATTSDDRGNLKFPEQTGKVAPTRMIHPLPMDGIPEIARRFPWAQPGFNGNTAVSSL